MAFIQWVNRFINLFIDATTTLKSTVYSKRLGTVEPVFGHLHNIGLNRFSLRGKKKVDHQWRLFCLVHNLLKIHRYAT